MQSEVVKLADTTRPAGSGGRVANARGRNGWFFPTEARVEMQSDGKVYIAVYSQRCGNSAPIVLHLPSGMVVALAQAMMRAAGGIPDATR